MNPISRQPARWGHRLSPRRVGTLYGVFSAIGYTLVNLLLRALAEDCDPIWVSCVKALPTALLAGVLVGTRAWQGGGILPSGRLCLYILAAGVVIQLGGNVAFQWALSTVGLALTVPLCFGTLIWGSALMGRFWLGEPITPRTAVALGLLILSVAILASAAPRSSAAVHSLERAEDQLPATWLAALGVSAAAISGLVYAFSAVVIRTATRSVSVSVTLGLISLTGVLTLGVMALWRIGVAEMLATSGRSATFMLLAGTLNAASFFALGKSLQLIPVAHANALNASQAAMATVCGILIFGEATNWSLVVGVALTIVGLVVMRDRRASMNEPV